MNNLANEDEGDIIKTKKGQILNPFLWNPKNPNLPPRDYLADFRIL